MYKNDMTSNSKCADAVLRKLIAGNGAYPSCPMANEHKSSCSMGDGEGEQERSQGAVRTWGLSGYPLASVYAPLQSFENIYDLEAALKNGTVFLELNLPFEGKTVKGGSCRA